MFNKYKFLFFIAGLSTGQIALAQNTPALSQTAPAGSTTVIPVPGAIGDGLASKNTITYYRPKTKQANANTVENGSGDQVKKTIEFRDGNDQVYQAIDYNHSRTATLQLKDLVQLDNTAAQQDKYSFLPLARNASSSFQANAFATEKSYYQGLYPNEGYTSYSATRYASDAGYRETRGFAPGKSQVGQGRYTAERSISNDASQVRIWTLDASGYPVSTAYYPANTLFGTQITDVDGNITISYKNKSGHLVLKEVQDGASSYASTYYVYDDMDHLSYTLPPRAVAAAAGGTLSADVRSKLCFHYVYDAKGRLEAEYQPGQNAGLTEMVYDRLQRPVMRRNPLEKSAGQWEVTFYDHSGRVIATSLYSSTATRDSWQAVFDTYSGATFATTDLKYYIVSDAGVGLYPPETGITGNTMMSYTWYDDYSVIDPNNSVYNNLVSTLNFTPDLLSSAGAETPARSQRTHGLVTGTKVRILPAPGIDTALTGDWAQTWNYYDDKGRLIDAERKDLYHATTVLHDHLTASQYDFSGKVILSKHILVNNKSKDGNHSHTELTRNDYDAVTDQLLISYHNVDNAGWNILADYKYDDLGRVQTETLGDGGETRDYDYNIRGQLSGINGHYAETGDKGGESKTFGESLKYDYGFTRPQYDGRIAGMVWRGSGGTSGKALAYGYSYDPAGRLTTADFREGPWQGGQVLTPATWDKDTMDYTVSGLTYDQNGNILTKNMRGPGYTSSLGSVPATIDQLTYTYASNSNQLNAVADKVTTNYDDGDFQDGNTTNLDYRYDQDGNLSQDLNKGISSVTYTFFDKPQTIRFANGNAINYSYTAAGNKVQEAVSANHNNKVTNYIGNFVYQDDSLQYASTGVGRTVWSNDTAKEEFFVKDHLGNVRSIIDIYHYPILQYLAGYEIASAQLEDLFFDDVDGIRDDKPGSTDPDDTKAGRLNGAEEDHRVGTSILVKVMAGDKVQINADNYYDGTYDPRNDQPVSPDDMLSSIVSTLTEGVGGIGGSESHNPGLVSKLFDPENYAQIGDLLEKDIDPDRPKAFLNYVLFDQNMRVVNTFTGAWQANGNGGWQTIGNTEPMDIPVNGYLAVYLSNATSFASCEACLNSEADVYFDKVNIRFTRGNLKQESHYYPFGLPMAAIGSSAVGLTPNRQKYQSNEYITDAGLNWMSFGARQYDPQIGRFLSVDPMASEGGQDMLSPYQAMGNDPTRYIDPDGQKIKIIGDASDPKLVSFLNSWLGEGNWAPDGDNNISIIPGHEDDAITALTNYFVNNMNDGSGGGGSAAATKAAKAYAGIVMAMITGDNFNGTITPGNEMDGHIYEGANGDFQVGPNAVLPVVGITGEKNKGWVEPANEWTGGFGMLASGVENFSGKLTLGSNLRTYATGWRGNQFVSTIKFAEIGKIVGVGTLVLGTAIDAKGVWNYYHAGPDDPNSVHPAQAGTNLGVGIWSMTNPGAAIGAAWYFGIETFYPGGNKAAIMNTDALIRGNQDVLGSDWNIYRDY